MTFKTPEMTPEETRVLIEEFQARKDIIDDDDKSLAADKKRNEAWGPITERVNACSAQQRTRSQIQVRMKNLKSRAKALHQQRKRHAEGTGGGPPLKKASLAEEKLIELYSSSVSWSDVPGGPTGAHIPNYEAARSAETSLGNSIASTSQNDRSNEPASKTEDTARTGGETKKGSLIRPKMKDAANVISRVRRLQIEALETQIESNREIISTCRMVKQELIPFLTNLKGE